MGYKISSLNSLPLVPDIDLYVFILGKNVWAGGWRKELERNFNKLAKEFGPSAAIVAGHDGVDLIHELVKVAESNENLSAALNLEQQKGTSLLLLGAHPNFFTNDDLALIVHEDHIERLFGSMEPFLNELCDFAKDRNEKFLSKFEEKKQLMEEVFDLADLRPNLFGIGININGAIEKFRSWRQKNA